MSTNCSFMKKEERIVKQKDLVEEIGRYFDKEGFQPIAGRILGLLMVMDKEQYTFEEIVEELQISKSSASITLKNLEIRGDIEYITLPGDRKRYFRMKRQNIFNLIEEFEKKFLYFSGLLKRAVELKSDKDAAYTRFLVELVEMLDFFMQKIQNSKDEFLKKK